MEYIYKMVMSEKLDYESIYKSGVDAGFNQGMAFGISEGKKIIVKNLLRWKIDINIIANATNLSIK